MFRRGRKGRQSDQRTAQGGRGSGGGSRPGSGPGGNCVCPSCGHTMAHRIGVRCVDISCPECGTKMVKE